MKNVVLELIYGTYNPAKFKSMVEMTRGLDIRILNLNEIKTEVKESGETGDSPLSNAKQKALTYYSQLKRPVFSCDSGLYFKEANDDDQPGIKIARVKGKKLNDREMRDYYSGLAKKYGGKLTAHYKNAICLVCDENNIYFSDSDELSTEEFYLTDTPHGKFQEGYPLDSLSVEIKSGKYYYDTDKRIRYRHEKGFYNFFKSVLEAKSVK